MIEILWVKDVALIEETEISFYEGLNIISGETGAGKSILLDAIMFLLGAKANKDFIRRGAEKATVRAIISVKDDRNVCTINDMGIECDDQVYITRTIHANGRSSCRVSGKAVSQTTLRALAAVLINIHGQHGHQALL
ncbi:MAG: AAA family ATPase, partial [Clostridiales bacterium]|nr:AAA family ATPase [Clostridiales bacterium]